METVVLAVQTGQIFLVAEINPVPVLDAQRVETVELGPSLGVALVEPPDVFRSQRFERGRPNVCPAGRRAARVASVVRSHFLDLYPVRVHVVVGSFTGGA